MLEYTEDGLRNIFHHDIKVNFIIFVPLSVESMLQSYYVRVIKLFHDLEFSIFVPLILVDFLNCNLLISLVASGLIDYTE